MLYDDQFQKGHQLLKDYGCKATFSNEQELKVSPVLSGHFFYATIEELMSGKTFKGWEEKVDVRLDVCLETKKGFSPKDQIRFAIEWSTKARLYSMFISALTTSKCISLSKNCYKTEDLLIQEIDKWILKAGCKRIKRKAAQKIEAKKYEQISLF